MRILIIGGGGREHALAWKIAQNDRVKQIYCAPGNAGIARLAECINLKPNDIEGLANFAERESIDLTVVGPEAPLIAGIVDRFEARGLPIFGPSTDPARIEGSKIFAKDLMVQYGIPTADYWSCATPDEAHDQVNAFYAAHTEPGMRLVIKADGIAAGKGVVIASCREDAHTAVAQIMEDRVFGAAGSQIVLEEFLEGEEVSVMAFTDGETVLPMPPSQDHKRAFDNDQGPNTGGMGAFSPVPAAPPDLLDHAVTQVLQPAVDAIRDLGIPYKGVLYAGLILTTNGLKTLEFNCRLGDPETQTVLPLLETDLVTILEAVIDSSLEQIAADVKWKRDAAACVVAVSGGYPGTYATGKVIEGLDRAAQSPNCLLFHAGTRQEHGQVLTDGGRVLNAVGIGATLQTAVTNAYNGMSQVDFEGIHYRRDIAYRALRKT